MFIPEKTKVTYVDEEKGSITQTLNYESCYGYSKNENGELYFDFFKGPIETEDTHYLKVDSLPEKGDSSYLYIVEVFDNGKAHIEVRSRRRETITFSGYLDMPLELL